MSGPLVVVGDALLDRDVDGTADRLCPDAPALVLTQESAVDRPGGAALAAVLACGLGFDVTLVTALADDGPGYRLRELLAAAGVTVHAMRLPSATPEKIRLRCAGRVLLRLDRGGLAPPRDDLPSGALAALRSAAGVLVSDYGGGITRLATLRRALPSPGLAGAAPVVWDPHPRGPAPVPGTRLVTPNENELHLLTGRSTIDSSIVDHAPPRRGAATGSATDGLPVGDAAAVHSTMDNPGADVSTADGSGTADTMSAPNGQRPHPAASRPGTAETRVLPRMTGLARGAAALRERWQAGAVAVTLGADGLLLCHSGPTPLVVPPSRRIEADSCGAGDQFAAAATAALASGALVSEAAQTAVRHAESYLAAGGPSTLTPPTTRPAAAVPASADAYAIAAAVRQQGGTVVASGGCFDLLHAGHVATLQAARRLGDCLIVCLNSDASVRALKGPGRPVVPAADRARLLAALGCVDAVLIFDEPTPHAVLTALRPDVWVKGGDYHDGARFDADSSALPEADLVRQWGGQTVIVPYLEGQSATNIIDAVRRRGAP